MLQLMMFKVIIAGDVLLITQQKNIKPEGTLLCAADVMLCDAGPRLCCISLSRKTVFFGLIAYCSSMHTQPHVSPFNTATVQGASQVRDKIDQCTLTLCLNLAKHITQESAPAG